MNEREKVVEKAKNQITTAREIYEYVLSIAIEMADEKLNFAEELKNTQLETNRVDLISDRTEYISVVVANLLQLSGELRL